jgi:hypothetical protein
MGAMESKAQAQSSYYKTGPTPPRLMGSELEELERQRAALSLGTPIVWTIIGGVTALTGGFILLIGLAIDAVPSSCDDEYSYYDCSDPDGSGVIVVGAVVGVAGIVMLAIALPSLFSRIDERRALGVRIKELRRQRDGGAVFMGDGPRLARSSPVLKLRF